MAKLTRITDTGLYSMSTAAYLADPCPDASLTQSIAKLLIERSPAHAWTAHPRLNPNYQSEESTSFDLGTTCHRLLLHAGRDFEVLPFDDYRSGAARAARDTVRKAGRTPILREQYERAIELTVGISDKVCDWIDFSATQNEIAAVVRNDSYWYRSLIDCLDRDGRRVIDVKTTDKSIGPYAIDRAMIAGGWDIQAAFQRQLLQQLIDNVDRFKFHFLAIEATPPYAFTFLEMSEAALTMGAKKVAYADKLWRHCLASGKWPAYPRHVLASYPEWAEKAWLTRELAEHDD